MSVEKFISELSEYLVDYKLSDADKKAISAMFKRNAPTSFAIKRDRIVEIPIEKTVYIAVPHLVYADGSDRPNAGEIAQISTRPRPLLSDIADQVCEIHGISVAELKRSSERSVYKRGKSESRLVVARTHFILLARKAFPFSSVEISEFLGYKGHTDVSRILSGKFRGNVATRYTKLLETVGSI